METIHYVSDFKYFSGRNTSETYGNVLNALRAHLKYIGRKAKDVFTFNLSIGKWIKKAEQEITKRWDSRVALKFVLALPIDVNEENLFFFEKRIRNFLEETLNVDKDNIGIAIHLHKGISGNYNPHAHVIIFPRDKNGKKLRLNKKDLSEFHRKWQKTLKELGYTIKRDKEPIEHLGAKLYYDKRAQEVYKEHLEIKRTEKRIKHLERKISQERALSALGEGEEKEFNIEVGIMDRLKDLMVSKDFKEKQKDYIFQHFEVLGYDKDDKIAILLVNHTNNDRIQRVVSVKQVLNDKFLSFLRAKNANGYSVYHSINTLKPQAKKRRKEDFKDKQRRIYLDLDAKGLSAKEMVERLYAYIKAKGLPAPTHIVQTSKNNFQVYWTLNREIDYKTLEKIMAKIIEDLEIDHTQDVSRVFRLPYFRNKKPGKNDLVKPIKSIKVGQRIIRATGKAVDVEPFLNLIKDLELPKPKNLEISKDFTYLAVEDFNIDLEPLKDYQPKLEPAKPAPVKDRKRDKLLRLVEHYLKEGYSEKNAYYRALLEHKGVLERIDSRLREIVLKSFEHKKDKSPSEVDASIIFGALYTGFYRLGSKDPETIANRFKVEEFISYGAFLREKVYPGDYVNRTFRKVESYYERKYLKNSSTSITNTNEKHLTNEKERKLDDYDDTIGLDL